jgi:pyruvate dehydrogenase E2 component (dihydrolipoamide acetyltransferase)
VGEFRMPSLGADMDEGTLIEWMVAPGDQVHRGDIVAVVDTEKSDIEVEVFEDGTIGELLVEVGATVPVGTPLARIDSGAPRPTPPPTVAPVTATATETAPAAATTVVDGPPRGLPTTARGAGRVLSPLVRHLAEELHIDLGGLTGTGPGGVVTRHDVEVARGGPAVAVEVAATGRPPLSGPPETGRVRASPYARRLAADRGVDLVAVSGSGPQGAVLALDVPTAPPSPALGREASARGVIGRAMARSKREIPHYYLQTTIDLDAALAWMRDRNADRSVVERVLPAALLLKATAVAAAEHPELNGWWEDGHRPSSRVHLGVAIALRRGGLVAPGIADADQMPISDLMAALRDLTARTRAGRVRQQEWTGPTITVTSLGDLGVEAVWGVIHPPQLAMVGYGVVHDGVVASDGQATVHPVVVATLAADHRSSDGIQGATFLGRIAKLLQDPEALDLPSPSKDGHHS